MPLKAQPLSTYPPIGFTDLIESHPHLSRAEAQVRRLREGTTVTALLALAPTNLVVETLKRTVNRTRPDGEHKRSNASFPSSHSANAFALAWVLARRWKRLAPLFWISASTVAISRLYLNRHYLSDVVVGALIGILSAWLVMRWMKGRRRRPRAAAAA